MLSEFWLRKLSRVLWQVGVRHAGEGQQEITVLLEADTEAQTSALVEEEAQFQNV
jgi:hypothetical protein